MAFHKTGDTASIGVVEGPTEKRILTAEEEKTLLDLITKVSQDPNTFVVLPEGLKVIFPNK